MISAPRLYQALPEGPRLLPRPANPRAGPASANGVEYYTPSGIVHPPLNGGDQMGAWALDLVPLCAFRVTGGHRELKTLAA